MFKRLVLIVATFIVFFGIYQPNVVQAQPEKKTVLISVYRGDMLQYSLIASGHVPEVIRFELTGHISVVSLAGLSVVIKNQ